MSLTPKQETFCLAYVETGNASEAYRRAYDARRMKPATINRKAADVLANGKIAARLSELRKRAEAKSFLTLEAHLDELASLRDAAKEKGQYSSAIRAEELRGKLCKFYDDNKEDPKGDDPIKTLPNHDPLREHFAELGPRYLAKAMASAANYDQQVRAPARVVPTLPSSGVT